MNYLFDDICDFYNGGAWSDKEYVNSGLPVLKVTNCKNNGFNIDDINYLPKSLARKYQKNKLQIGDVIIATVGSHPNLTESAAGRASIVNSQVEGFYLNQNAVCIRTKNNNVLDQGYLGYVTKGRLFQHYIQMRGRGAANQMRIAIQAIKSYEIDLPDIDEQKKIASILSAYDGLIENNQKQIKLLEEAAQRLYKEWFVDLRFPGHENVKIVDGVPEGWERRLLSKVFSYVRGKSYSSKDLVEQDGILLVNLKNIRAYGGYNSNAEKHFIGKYNDNQILSAGDIIMAVTDMTQERRLVGYVAVVPRLRNKAIFSMDLIKLIPLEVTTSYLYSTLNFGNFSKKVSMIANGVNVLHLKPDTIMNMEMIIPSDKIMLQYNVSFENFRNKIELLKEQIDKLQEARDRLLPKLLSGEIMI